MSWIVWTGGDGNGTRWDGALRTMVFRAIDNGWLTRDPFHDYKVPKVETTRGFLTKEEIHLLMNGELKRKTMRLIRDLYLFCCFT